MTTIKTVKFAFYKAKGSWMDRLIRLWMRGKYAHVECVLEDYGDGTYQVASSVPGIGVRIDRIALPETDYDILEAPGDVGMCQAWFAARVGAKYDYIGLFTFILHPVLIESRNKYWCSEACLLAAGYAGAQREDPNSMYDTLYNAAQFAGLSVPCIGISGAAV